MDEDMRRDAAKKDIVTGIAEATGTIVGAYGTMSGNRGYMALKRKNGENIVVANVMENGPEIGNPNDHTVHITVKEKQYNDPNVRRVLNQKIQEHSERGTSFVIE